MQIYNIQIKNYFSNFEEMETCQIEILSPKVIKLLEDLADLHLISIKNPESLFQTVQTLRKKALKDIRSLTEITK